MMKKLIIICSICVLAISTCHGQEAQKNKVVVFKDFSGGLNTKFSDQSTDPKYARIAENVRLNAPFKSIAKRDQIYLYGNADTSEAITGMHRIYLSDLSKTFIVSHGDEIEVGSDTTGAFTTILDLSKANYRWDFITWHDLGIGGDGFNYTVKTDGTDATYLGTAFAEDASAGAGPDGTYTYKVSCHTATYALTFDVPSNSVTVSDNDIDLSMIPIGPSTILGEDIAARCIWRNTVAAQDTWYLITGGTISDNTTTTLTDSASDAELQAYEYPTGDEVWTPPKGKRFLIHKNRTWVGNNPDNPSRLYYSENGSHDLFDPTAYFDIRKNDGDEITFIKNQLGNLVAGKTNTIQKVYTNGTDPSSDWSVSDPFSFIGCDAPYSAVNTPTGIYYLSKAKSGIYVFNGQNSILKSEQATPVIEDISPSDLNNVDGEYNNNLYYLAYPSIDGGGIANNRLLVVDMLSNAYTIDLLSFSSLTSFTGSGDGGILYAGSSLDGKVYSFSSPSQTIVHNKHADFTGTWAHTRYIPEGVAGGDASDPILEIAWSDTIDDNTSIIDNAVGDINRSTGGGTYISPILNTPGATAFDRIYWNETLVSGTNATFAVRSGDSHTSCEASAWSSEFSLPTGSDISGVTSAAFTQYRMTLSTTDIDYTPNVNTLGGFTVKLDYTKLGTAGETAIAMHHQTGFLDFELPTQDKVLRKIIVYHEGTNGTLKISFTNERGESESFEIDLAIYPTTYEAYFTGLYGKKFQMDILNSDLNSLTIKEIVLVMDVEPYV